MITLQQNASHGQDPQLNLPTGPTHLLPRGRKRTDADKLWHSQQVKVGEVEIENVHYRDVFRQMVFHGSCNPGRLCFAAHASIADAKKISTKTVQRAARYLEGSGLIRRMSEGKGRTTGTYQILGRTESPCRVDSESMQHGLKVHQIEKGIEEGIEEKEKALSFKDKVKPIDPEEKEVNLSLFPSIPKSKSKKAKALGTKKPIVVFSFPKIVALWFKVKRKLGHYVDDTMALAFDRLPHREKTVIIDGLEAVEQEQVYLGKVAAPPLTRPKGFLTAEAEEAQRLAACEHEPADDLPVACRKCGGFIG